jgi:hypothetical protein
MCGRSKNRLTTRGLFECKHCLRQTSVTAGTLFHNTRKYLRVWFEAMWHITNQKYGANALGLQRILGLGSYHTAWRRLHKFRRAMGRPGRDNLSGTVEIDKTYIGGKSPGKRGRRADKKSLVAVAVEDKSQISPTGNGIGCIRLSIIPDASAISLNTLIQDHINEGSHIRTDGWSGYQNLPDLGYKHTVVDSKELNIAHLTISLTSETLVIRHVSRSSKINSSWVLP